MNLYLVAVKNKNLLYDPYVAFLDKEKAMNWAKNQALLHSNGEILLLPVPDDWRPFPRNGVYVALWYDHNIPSFFPDSVSLFSDKVEDYIKLLPEEIQENCIWYRIPVRE